MSVKRFETIVKNDKRTVNAWVMYDWANSVYVLSITSAIFPVYYNTVTKVNGGTIVEVLGMKFENTGIYSINLGIAFGIVALISPLVSSVADYIGNHRAFMRFFCYMGVLGCLGLYFFDSIESIHWGLACTLIATVGYAGSIVFYNSYLPAIVTEDRMDKTSAKGFSYGYFGSTLLLLLNLFMIMNKDLFGVTDTTLMPRISFLMTGIWWLGFSQITFSRLPKGIYEKRTTGRNLLNGYHELQKVWHFLKSAVQLRTFLLSFFFYIMGVQTVMFMAASFGEKEVHLTVTQLIVTILLLQFLGILGAFIFSWVSKKLGNFKALTIAIVIWIFICLGAFFIRNPLDFYIAAFFIGLVMGGIQSLSRSTYSKLIPQTENNAGYFSFYDVCEKLAMMFGLLLWGLLDDWTGSMRNAIMALFVWFVIGLALMIWIQRMKAGKTVELTVD
ncbi:MAG: MFS transporter [Saprospiraceae bacterium]|nr:MFS transporter [Saprospiraceae bacterium]MCF8249319.1 MFS transporter [Saprospiraceae bacterium]MCF8279740.1 MFS transporter [Bacteroidales bacterium]MCF8311404.1 MFS transporter [Saprospiraceae bacterium]MCF8439938.1 MFS transporter [Saprospiraceae bacterium]